MATSAVGSVKGRARFAAACGVLSQYVKSAAAAAPPAPMVVALPLMPGADIYETSSQEEQEPASCASTHHHQSSKMSIFYGGRVLVLDDVPADRAAEVLRLAANSDKARPGADLMPVARKASLQRFMEKRRGRVATRASTTPYSRPDHSKGTNGDGDSTLTLSL